MKSGFSIIMAVIFIVVLASIGALSISMSSTGAKTTLNLFLKEQIRLLAEGSVEYAILKVQQNDFGTQCLDNINITYDNFDANLTITYIGPESLLKDKSGCASIIPTNSKAEKVEAIRIDGKVSSRLQQNENISYSFTTTQIP